MTWKQTLTHSRFYARNPVRLPGYISPDLSPAARKLLLDFYAQELASIGSPGPLMRWGLILPAWFLFMVRASFRHYRMNRASIRRAFPELSAITLWGRMVNSVFANNIPPWEFFRYKLYLDGNYQLRRHYLLAWQLDPLLADSRPERKSTSIGNKYDFWKIMSKTGLPLPPVIARIRDGEWLEGSWSQLAAEAEDLVLKPVFRCNGRGIAFLDADPAGGWRVSGKSLTNDEARAFTEKLSYEDTYVIQHRLDNHPVFESWGIQGAITVRIVTMKTRAMAKPTGLLASLQVPAQGVRIPSIKQGGLICSIDWETGMVNKADGIRPEHRHLDAHPQTGGRLKGTILPYWEECKKICLAAHLADPRLNSIGWDIVITPEGPVLLEANGRWGGQSSQTGGNRPLLDTKFPELYEAWPEADI